MRYLLWIPQVLLALVFVLSGVLKFVLPAHQLTTQFPLLSVAFIWNSILKSKSRRLCRSKSRLIVA